ncbi:MAG TPA: hypothetical protein VNZ55_03995 [Thermomicrobiales bacterium]|nr:hypothetical protein [Thermomicrobiales bacterium]
MAATYPPKTRLLNPRTWFAEDIIADNSSTPALEDPDRTPTLKIYVKGEGPGNPDIVTRRTEAYIVAWSDKMPDPLD